VLCEEGAWVVIDRNHGDSEAMYGLFYLTDYEVFKCVTCKPPTLYVIKFVIASEDVFKKERFHGCNE